MPSFDPSTALGGLFTDLDGAFTTNVPIVLAFVGILIVVGVVIGLIKRFVPGA